MISRLSLTRASAEGDIGRYVSFTKVDCYDCESGSHWHALWLNGVVSINAHVSISHTEFEHSMNSNAMITFVHAVSATVRSLRHGVQHIYIYLGWMGPSQLDCHNTPL